MLFNLGATKTGRKALDRAHSQGLLLFILFFNMDEAVHVPQLQLHAGHESLVV